jgi:PAS domain S-box-containing protein
MPVSKNGDSMMHSKARILVVDDDPDLLNINASILQSAGLEVIEASTGNECVSTAREILPDVILLDVNLPDANGFDVCKQIKADPLLANTYVILISGIEISSKSKVYGLDLGADEYLIRPISGRELLARVKAMIRLKDAEIALRKSKEQYQMLAEELERRVVDRTMQLEAVVKELESEIIERKRIEKDLRIKEIAIASSINAIAFADLEGTLTYVNNAFLQLWGYETGRDILYKPIMLCWQDRGKADKVMGDLLARGWCMGAMIGRRDDGSTFDAQFSANVVAGSDGTPVCVEASFIDITERKRNEEAMVQYAERLQSLSARLLEAQESERRCIAQELHDEIGQVLKKFSERKALTD